jgi:hypothetical protein
LASLFVQSGFTQSLNYSNNFFITGDYVVGGVGLKGLGDASGYAKGLITIPDITYGPSAGVPDGADVVAAFLYWQTVDFSGSLAGKQGFFRGKPIVETFEKGKKHSYQPISSESQASKTRIRLRGFAEIRR